jgi:hypothetical protein
MAALKPLRDFLADYVEGYEELATLVALHAAGGEASAVELGAATRLRPSALAEVIERLARAGVVRTSGEHVALAIDDPRLAELAALYRNDPVAVLTMMNALAIERVRLGATRAFADAFVIRRNKSDG